MLTLYVHRHPGDEGYHPGGNRGTVHAAADSSFGAEEGEMVCKLEDFSVILSAGKQRLDMVQPDTDGAASGPQPEGSVAPRSPHGEKKEA